MINKGFTLLEILIVLIIIGIASTFTFLAFGDFGASRKATVEAEQFASVIKVIQQRAILEINTFGITINNDGYQVYQFDQNTQWLPLPATSILHSHLFPQNIQAHFAMNLNTRPNTPQIIINPSGDMTEFQLYFGTSSKTKVILLIGQHNGDVVLRRGKNEE